MAENVLKELIPGSGVWSRISMTPVKLRALIQEPCPRGYQIDCEGTLDGGAVYTVRCGAKIDNRFMITRTDLRQKTTGITFNVSG